MSDVQLGAIESRFADMIWEREPVASSELVRRCAEELGWKKTTTFTVLKRLCNKGLFCNDGGTVTSAISREDYYAARSESFVEDNFGGSLPAFFAAFTARKKLSPDELERLKNMIDDCGK